MEGSTRTSLVTEGHPERAFSVPALRAPEHTYVWYAACTRLRHEKSVAKELEERRIEYFLPMYRSVRRWKDRRQELDLVLFPGYVFVRLHWPERLQVLQLPGVLRFVTFNGLPAALPITELESLRKGLTRGVYAESHPYLRVGKRVLVRHGPLAGPKGLIIRKQQHFRRGISI